MTLRIRGDEYFHWEENEDGYTAVRGANGTVVYATLNAQDHLVPTIARVGIDDPAAIGLKPGILPPLEVRIQQRAQVQAALQDHGGGVIGARPPAAGIVKNLVIMMRFSNHLTRTLPSNGDFDIIFNHVGPHTLAPTGSLRDLYFENSYGQMTLNSTVFGWVTLPQTEQFYAAGNSGLGSNIWGALVSALNGADPLIDFRQFDEDGDGFVDAIAFIHSGYGAEWGGTDADGTDYTNRIWSHRWAIPTWTSAEGVKVSDYHISPGLWGTSGSAPGRIGVIAHETGHFFGLPDLYDTDYSSSGIGSYCMMANSWGFTGNQLNPPHFSAWCKQQLGWVTVTVLGMPGTYTAMRVETSQSIYRINAGYATGEYLLIENRQPYGFESTMPQGGLAVWHIDEAKGTNTEEGFPGQSGWPQNNKHYRVALLQADGLYELEKGTSGGDAEDLYRGGEVSEVSAATTPNTDAYQSGFVVPTFNRIRNISISDVNMTFDYDVVEPGPGACCNDFIGDCIESVSLADCNSPGERFAEKTTCVEMAPSCGIYVPPANDYCVNAIPIVDGLTAFSNLSATTDGPNDCLDSQGRPLIGKLDLWYRYQATCTGGLSVSLCSGTDFDGTLQIYEGTSCTPLGTQVGCSDDDCGIGGGPPILFVAASLNQSYLLRVGGWRDQAGFGSIEIQCTESVPPPRVVWDSDLLSLDRATRTLKFALAAAEAATGSIEQSAIKVTMVDLQHPNPKNLPARVPPNFTAFDTRLNGICAGGSYPGHHCDSTAECAGGGSCSNMVACTATGEMNGCARWVGKVGTFRETQDGAVPTYRAARLQCTPYYNDWVAESAGGPVTVFGAEIVPSSEYSVQTYGASCKGLEAGCTNVSAPVKIFTRRSSDVESPFNPPSTTVQPDVTDVAQVVAKLKNVPNALPKSTAQLQPNIPELNTDVNALDIVAVVDAARGSQYAFPGPCRCPSAVRCGPAAGSVACANPTVCVSSFGAGATCVRTCVGGDNSGDPCIDSARHCPGGVCGNGGATPGFCRDACGRCTP